MTFPSCNFLPYKINKMLTMKVRLGLKGLIERLKATSAEFPSKKSRHDTRVQDPELFHFMYFNNFNVTDPPS